MAEPVDWLLLFYKAPGDQARLRATVWRRAKALGAVHLQSGIVALPASPVAERAFRALRHEIIEFNGTGYLMHSRARAGQADVISLYNGARDEEYLEIVDHCVEVEEAIENDLVDQDLTYSVLEKLDAVLEKLKNRLSNVQARDVLHAEQAPTAIKAVARCETMVEKVATRAYGVGGT